jgi:hypothetical protein
VQDSYDRIAMIRVWDDVYARANAFVLMRELNDENDVSSHAQYYRPMNLLSKNKGRITVDMMKTFSMDHEHGPSCNSICRHAGNFREERTSSAAVMAMDRDNPALSEIHIALGKPCVSWRNNSAHVRLNMQVSPRTSRQESLMEASGRDSIVSRRTPQIASFGDTDPRIVGITRSTTSDHIQPLRTHFLCSAFTFST